MTARTQNPEGRLAVQRSRAIAFVGMYLVAMAGRSSAGGPPCVKRTMKHSAGLLMYRRRDGEIEVLLAHPGGPFWAHRDEGAWSIPKGLIEAGEAPLAAAVREFEEETGVCPSGPYLELPEIEQKNRKIVHAWAFEGDCDTTQVTSNTFTMEFPRGSGKMAEFPEIDRAEFFAPDEAKRRINPAQAALVDALVAILEGGDGITD